RILARPPPRPPPFPYTTLFRSQIHAQRSVTRDELGDHNGAAQDRLAASGLARRVAPEVRSRLIAFIEIAEGVADRVASPKAAIRSEEHTSELQSRFDLVCRLLL